MTMLMVTLRMDDYRDASPVAQRMDGFTLDMPHLPRKGDFIRDGDYGEVEVVKICYNTQGGGITLHIK